MIVITDTELESVLKQLLQKQLKFWVNNKVWREGRLLLFKQSGFYLELIIKSKKKDKEKFEIPIPFKHTFCFEKNTVIFSYELGALTGENNKDISWTLGNIKPIRKSRFYNVALEIQITPDVIYERKI